MREREEKKPKYFAPKRQDTIDNLALDTLFKMELLMGKINTVIVQNSRKQENSGNLDTDNITLEENEGK